MTKKCRINVVILEKPYANAVRTAVLESMFLLNGVPSKSYNELIFHTLSGLSKYYVNQNDELMLPHSVLQ